MDMVQKARLDAMIKKRAKQYFDEWIADFQEGIMAKDLQLAQERKELFAIVNRLGRHVDTLEGRISALETHSNTSNNTDNGSNPTDIRTVYDVNSLMKRVSVLEEVCGYDIRAESADALFLGSGALIHPSRNIATRLDKLESQCREKTNHKSTSLDKMPLFITLTKQKPRPNTCHGIVSDDPRYEDMPVMRLTEKYAEQGPELDLEPQIHEKPPSSPRRSKVRIFSLCLCLITYLDSFSTGHISSRIKPSILHDTAPSRISQYPHSYAPCVCGLSSQDHDAA